MTIEILPYFSRTGTLRNLRELRKRDWRILVSATGRHKTEGFDHHGLDCGAWTVRAYTKDDGTVVDAQPFPEAQFTEMLDKLGATADWTVCPDIVFGGLRSLEFSLTWLERVRSATPRVLLAVQNDMEVADVQHLISPTVGIFIGGDDTFKETTAARWAALARSRDAWCHMGRVNSQRRINICSSAGVTSFDGTSATRFAKSIPKLERARRQLSLLVEVPSDDDT